MIDLARHVSVILKQIRFVARHAVCETRSEDSQSIAAMRQIVAELRRSASAIETEAKLGNPITSPTAKMCGCAVR